MDTTISCTSTTSFGKRFVLSELKSPRYRVFPLEKRCRAKYRQSPSASILGRQTAKASWNTSAFIAQAVTNRIANATYVLDFGLQRPAVLANSNFVILQPC